MLVGALPIEFGFDDLEHGLGIEAASEEAVYGLDRGARVLHDVVVADVESLEVLVNPRDKGLLSEAEVSRISAETGKELGTSISLRVSEEPLTCIGGVVVRSADGKVRVDNTFEARIERFRETIRTHVAKELFPQES